MPRLPHLNTLQLFGLSGGNTNLSALKKRGVKLDWLTLESQGEIHLDTKLGRLHWLTIKAQRITGTTPLPKSVESLSLSLLGEDEGGVERLLSSVRSVKNLHLDGTKVGDEFILRLCERFALKYLSVRDTLVSEGGVEAIKAHWPKLRMHH